MQKSQMRACLRGGFWRKRLMCRELSDVLNEEHCFDQCVGIVSDLLSKDLLFRCVRLEIL